MGKILDSRIQKNKMGFIGGRLFGRSLRLQVAAWVFDRADPTFYQAEAIKGLDYAGSQVRDELARLVEIGMLTKFEPGPGERRVYYSRTDSPLWGAIRSTLEALESVPGPQAPGE